MSSRIEKYENYSADGMSRTSRNQHIYTSNDLNELSRIKTNTNVSVISDATKTIDLDKIRKYLDAKNEASEEKYQRISLELPKEEEVVIVKREEKDYDIKSVLERAKENREVDYEIDRHRKINNTQIDILKSIKIREQKQPIDDDILEPIDELNTEEKTLVDLIQNIQGKKTDNKKDLFADLMGDPDDTMVLGQKDELKEMLLDMTQELESIKEPENEFTQEINMEKLRMLEETSDDDIEETDDNEEDVENTDEVPEIKEVDKSFYTNSIMFDKNDFEGFDELEKESKKSSFLAKIAVLIVVLMLLGTIFLIANFVFDLNLI